MGKLSLDTAIYHAYQQITEIQTEAKEKVAFIIRNAKSNDPAFFEIAYNPYNSEVNYFVLVNNRFCSLERNMF